MSKVSTNRRDILETAIKLTCGDRDVSYGSPSVNLGCIGELIAIYQKYSSGKSDGHEASIIQVLTKIGRIANGQFKEDNYLDGAAYLGIAYECEYEKLNAPKIDNQALLGQVIDCPCDVCSCGSKGL